MNSHSFDIQKVIDELKSRRPIFVSEADLQLEMAWTIKNLYKNARIRLEYTPVFDPNLHLDILVIIDDKWYPIELKYKKLACKKTVESETFNLKNDGARDVGCYLYLKDIERIENIKKNIPEFEKGYAIILTNDLGYVNLPKKSGTVYDDFAIKEGKIKTGKLRWQEGAKTGEQKQTKKPLNLSGTYLMHWETYSHLDDTASGTFMYTLAEI
jgi:hypothetical protein